MNPGIKIRLLRMQAKLSQGELAEKIGVTQAVMSRIELGRRQLTLQELETLAEFFNVRIESFLKDNVTLDELYKRGDLARLADENGNVGETQEASVRVPVFDIEAGYTVSFDDGGHPSGIPINTNCSPPPTSQVQAFSVATCTATACSKPANRRSETATGCFSIRAGRLHTAGLHSSAPPTTPPRSSRFFSTAKRRCACIRSTAATPISS